MVEINLQDIYYHMDRTRKSGRCWLVVDLIDFLYVCDEVCLERLNPDTMRKVQMA